MNEQEMKRILIVSFFMNLQNLDNMTVAVLNNHINGWGRVAPDAEIFSLAREYELVNANGHPHPGVAEALMLTIQKRVEQGTWQ